MATGTEKLVVLMTKGIDFGIILGGIHYRQRRPDGGLEGVNLLDE